MGHYSKEKNNDGQEIEFQNTDIKNNKILYSIIYFVKVNKFRL